MPPLPAADLQSLQDGIKWKLLCYAEPLNTDIVPTPPQLLSICDQADQRPFATISQNNAHPPKIQHCSSST